MKWRGLVYPAAVTLFRGSFAAAAVTSCPQYIGCRQCAFNVGMKAHLPTTRIRRLSLSRFPCIHMMSITSSSKPPANLYAQLKRHSKIIADTADYQQIETLPPTDEVTTNPTIIWQGAQFPQYFHLLEETCNMYISMGKNKGIGNMIETVPVKFAREILKHLPRSTGKVYLQIDPRASFDIEQAKQGIDPRASFDVQQAKQGVRSLLELAHYHQIPREKLVFKIPGSWEGIQAAKELEAEGIPCLVTAVTSMIQAAAAAQAGVSYVAPYVGRVCDYKGEDSSLPASSKDVSQERGIVLARDMQIYYQIKGYNTKVMAASLRGPEQVKALAGCDILTISPKLIVRLECEDPDDDLVPFLPTNPTPQDLKGGPMPPEDITEAQFREALQKDDCGTAVFSNSMKSFMTGIRSLEKVFFDYLQYAETKR